MLKNSATIGFIISHACPLRCDFCWHDRDTIGKGRIDRDTMARTMIAFGAEPGVTQFAFSGGEPMLYFADIVAALEAARAAGVRQPFHIATAGHWAAPDTTETWLRRLADLGMNKIQLSYDREHARFVKPEQIMDICRTARALGIRVDLHATFWRADEDIRDLLPGIDDWARVRTFAVEQGGRAKDAGRTSDHAKAPHEKLSCGRPSHYLVALYPDGEAYPCCAGDFNKAAELSCGNIHRDTAATILERAYGSMHVRMAKELGWGVLYEVIARERPDLRPALPDIAAAGSCCEICRELNTRHRAALAPVYAGIERVYARAMAGAEWERLDREAVRERRCFAGGERTRDELMDLLEADETVRRRYMVDAETLED